MTSIPCAPSKSYANDDASKVRLPDPEYVDSDNEDFYHEDDEVAETDRQRLIDDFVVIGKKVRDALVQRSNEESLPQPKRSKLNLRALNTSSDVRKSYKDDGIANLPTTEMTGVDPEITRMCAALSGQIYDVKKADDLDLTNPVAPRDVQVILFDDFGKLAETTPPMAIAITGKTMIIGWCGSQTLMDWALNVAFSPLASRAWTHVAPRVRAHGGYCALVESYFSQYQAFIVREIKERDINELIFTGHSLAGGVAQVAHMFVEGERQRLTPLSEWPISLSVRCIAFSAPMTTMTLDRKHKQSADFIKNIGKNVANIIYASDPVPRAYAELDFINELIINVLPQLSKGIPVPGIIKWVFDLQSKIEDAINSTFASQKELIKVMSAFRHIGKVVYYASETIAPVEYIDKGSSYKPTAQQLLLTQENLFRDIQYVESDDVMKVATDHHLFLISGRGLAYNRRL
jgi:hypothetical protein